MAACPPTGPALGGPPRPGAPPPRPLRGAALALLLGACAPADDAGDAGSPTAPWRGLREVEIAPAVARDDMPRALELRGLVTGLVELGLTDLPGVLPRVAEAPPSPGLAHPLPLRSERWTLRLQVDQRDEVVMIDATACAPTGRCAELQGQGPGAEAATARLLHALARQLDRSPVGAADLRWQAPLSKDPYAILLSGRAAAAFYGLRPAAAPGDEDDPRKDPIARAVLVDPGVPLSTWVQARDRARRGVDPGAALERAMASRPEATALLADAAAAADAARRPARAREAWEQVAERAPRDPRYALPLTRARLAHKDPAAAAAALDALPADVQDLREVIELRVGVADALGPPGADDALLGRWQEAAPDDPVPVRRRVADRAHAGDLAGAFALLDALEARGERELAGRWRVALSLDLAGPAAALAAAEALGDPAVLDRVRARAEGGPPPPLAEPVARLAWAEAELRAGRPAVARAAAEGVISRDPHLPEAWSLLARVAEATGDADGAAKARQRAAFLDPAAG